MPGYEEGQRGDRPLQGLNINDFIEDLARLSEPIPQEFNKVIDENFWDLF